VEFRKKLTEFESTMAFVVGGGMTLIILAFMLASARGAESNFTTLNIMLIVGAGLLVLGLIAWSFVNRPWETGHDDWSVPLYTGHDAHHDDHQAHRAEPTPEARAVHAHASAAEVPHEKGMHMGATEEPPRLAPAPARDDLTAIEGIGPKIAAALMDAGVGSFAQLAGRQPDELEHIVRRAGVRMVGRADTWPQQAQLAAEGRFKDLKKLQEDLKAGRTASSD
jgi:predicted flap endonuclease-1-like 5' DNA nuclease